MVKRLFLLLLTMVGVLSVEAGNYTYLTFEMTDGVKASVPVTTALTITISGNTLKAGDQTFVLVNLKKMYFSDDNETTAISEVTQAVLDEAEEIYDMRGHRVEKSRMKRGVYIVKTKQKTYKITVK